MLKAIIDFFLRFFASSPPLFSDASDIEPDSVVVITRVDPQPVEPTEVIPDQPEKAKHKPRYLWCIDNGHGAKTAGKRSPKLEDGRQLLEWKWNREVVNLIAQKLEEAGVYFYIVVPEDDIGDTKKELKERVNRANSVISDLPKRFVSVHSNAAPAPSGQWCDPKISGVETWFYYNSEAGRKMAEVFQRHLIEATGWKNRHIKSRPDDQFYVLKNTKMTAVLTENGFYNNKAQCLELLKEETKERIAEAHVRAILEIENNINFF